MPTDEGEATGGNVMALQDMWQMQEELPVEHAVRRRRASGSPIRSDTTERKMSMTSIQSKGNQQVAA